MDDIYKNIEEYNANKEHKILIVFNMIADMLSIKKLNPIVNELFIIYLVILQQSYFSVPKYIRLNFSHYSVMKLPHFQSFNKSHLIILQILSLKTLWIFTKIGLQNTNSDN